MSVLGQFQFRRDTAANWSSVNPILLDGELGIESNTDLFKLGDGVTAWNALPYGGLQGQAGVASTTVVGATTVINPNQNPSVTDADAGPNADLRFSLPRAREVTAAVTNTVAPGTSASVTSSLDAEGDVMLTFNIPRGAKGWTPVLSVVTDGERRVLRLVDYVDGEGTKPTIPADNYIGPTGLTNLAGAVDIRGATGATGPAANSFVNIAVSGQSTVVADQASDTLTLVNGTGVTITTDAATDSVTITNNDRGSTAVDTHVAAGDPHPQYTTTAEASAAAPVQSVSAGTGISVNSNTGAVTVTNNDTGSSAVSSHVAQSNPHTQYSRLTKNIFYAEDYGPLVDGTDAGTVSGAQAAANYNTIATAIAACIAGSGGIGGTVLLPPGTFHVDATLVINQSGIVLEGAGAYGNSDVGSQTGFGTTLFWNNTASPATTAMIDVTSVQGASNPAIKRSGVRNLTLQCAGNVGIGIRVKSIHWGRFENIYIVNPTAEGLATECFVTGTELGEAADVTKCTFDNIGIRLLEVPDTAKGFSFDGSTNANTSNSTFRNLAVSCKGAQLAVDIRNTDSNRFYDTVINQSNGGTVQPIVLRGAAAEAQVSRGNMFFGLASGGSSTGIRGLKSEGTDTAGVTFPAMNNVVYGYSIENGEPAPLIGTGSVLEYYLAGGAATLARRATLTNSTTTTETIVARWLLPENSLSPNVVYEGYVAGQVSSTATLIYRIRIGTAGTTADAVAGTFTTSAAGVRNAHSAVNFLVSALTAGTSGTATASGIASLAGAARTMATAAFAAATVNTTARLFVSVTVQQSTAQTHTTRIGSLVRVT